MRTVLLCVAVWFAASALIGILGMAQTIREAHVDPAIGAAATDSVEAVMRDTLAARVERWK